MGKRPPKRVSAKLNRLFSAGPPWRWKRIGINGTRLGVPLRRVCAAARDRTLPIRQAIVDLFGTLRGTTYHFWRRM